MDMFHQSFLRNYLIKEYEIFDNFVFFSESVTTSDGYHRGYVSSLTEIIGLWLIPAALELQYCGSRAANTCSSRAALKYFVCKLVFRL